MAPLGARPRTWRALLEGAAPAAPEGGRPAPGVERQPACVAVLRDGPRVREELHVSLPRSGLAVLALVEGDAVPAFQEPRRDQSEVWTKPEYRSSESPIARVDWFSSCARLRGGSKRGAALRSSSGAPPWVGQRAPKRGDGQAEDHRADDERIDTDGLLQPSRREHRDDEERDGREGEEAERPRERLSHAVTSRPDGASVPRAAPARSSSRTRSRAAIASSFIPASISCWENSAWTNRSTRRRIARRSTSRWPRTRPQCSSGCRRRPWARRARRGRARGVRTRRSRPDADPPRRAGRRA